MFVCKVVCYMQIRVMPNTPCLIGQAASAYVIGTHATEADAQKTYALMSSVGENYAVDTTTCKSHD